MNLHKRIAMVSLALAACGGGSSSSNSNESHASSATTESSSSGGSTTESNGDAGPGEHRSGLSMHIQNMHAGGALPAEADPRTDHLDVSFELVLNHNGAQALTGIAITRARLVADDGREIVFGVLSDGWDGRLETGQQRVLLFHKTPDSATPRATHSFCRSAMRIEITVQLGTRTSTAQSRHVQIECPAATH